MNAIEELHRLTALFPDGADLIDLAEHVPSALTPEPYKGLLAHDHHMTLAMEAYYETSVAVRVLDRGLKGNVYTRKISLQRTDIEQVVQFGIVRFDLTFVTADVRTEILKEETPLGRILIDHNVLRHIDLGAILRIVPGPALQKLFGCAPGRETYGRLATIFCNRQPAVDLLEIAAPVEG
ncbi:MAG: hypothetical protein ACKV0T_24520 [Planctomycetales bacterium]